MGQEVDVTPHTYVKVIVIHEAGVRWNGKDLLKGETFVAQHYQIEPAIQAGQVKLVSVMLDYEPLTGGGPVEIPAAPEPPDDG